MTVFLAITIPVVAAVAYLAIGLRLRRWVQPRAVTWAIKHPSYNSPYEDHQREIVLRDAGAWRIATVWFWPVTVPIVWRRSRPGYVGPDQWEQYAPWAIEEREAEQRCELERRQTRIRQLERELGIRQEERRCHIVDLVGPGEIVVTQFGDCTHSREWFISEVAPNEWSELDRQDCRATELRKAL